MTKSSWKHILFERFHALEHSTWEVLTIIAGTLIVVQGFETTRFMGG